MNWSMVTVSVTILFSRVRLVSARSRFAGVAFNAVDGPSHFVEMPRDVNTVPCAEPAACHRRTLDVEDGIQSVGGNPKCVSVGLASVGGDLCMLHLRTSRE